MKTTMLKRLSLSLGAALLAACIGGVYAFADSAPTAMDVRFTKTLVTPQSDLVTIPDLTFTFDFKEGVFYPYTASGVDTNPDSSVTVPEITDQNITFTEADMLPANDANGANEVTKQSTNVISGVTFPKVGMYEYKVKETSGTADGNLDANLHAKVNYDATEYTLRIWVTNDGNGGTKTEGTVEVTDPKGDKVDPNPETPTDPTNPDIVANPDKGKTFNFKNVYTVDAVDPGKPVDPTDPETAPFRVNKKVTGQMGDLTLGFDFTLDIEKTELTNNQTFKLNIKDKDGNVIDTIDVTPGTAANFKLKHGDVAYFDEITAGAKVTVIEADATDYDETNVANFGGVSTTGTLSASGMLSTAGENSAAYTNNQTSGNVTPTGILLNNLPYIALIIAAFAGLGVYFVSKRRHNA